MPTDKPVSFNNDPRWRLIDPTPIREENPYTFFLPSQKEKSALVAGDVIKLMFESTELDTVERMWVEFQGKDEFGCYGELENEPYEIEGLSHTDMVRFDEHHILSVWKMKHDTIDDEERYFARCHVDQRILSGDCTIERLERRKPKWFWWWHKYRDTGWHIFGPDTSDQTPIMEYVAIGVVLNRDDGFLQFLDKPVGTKIISDENGFKVF